MIESIGFRGLAYCGPDGRWRNASNDDELMGRIYLVDDGALLESLKMAANLNP